MADGPEVTKSLPATPMHAGPAGETAKREEAILEFWRTNGIFEKSLKRPAPKGEFVFYDGPPFATGLPHTGSLLSSIIKDVIPRYKTMQGFRVRRRWGWDCHGLPIESLIEKRLNLKTKKDIERIGVDVFNEAARASVLEFEHEWSAYIERVGRWVDFKNSYKTMDNSYIESVWWALKRFHEKGLLYEGKKVLMYCTHCETPLAKAEIAMDQTYKDITEEAVVAKFKIRDAESRKWPSDTYFLAWTTTPWTLPGNVALAVGGDIAYALFKKGGTYYVAAQARLPEGSEVIEEMQGSQLIDIEYEPLFDIPALRTKKSFKVYAADFVNTEEGTGIVHTAVMYGEDDYALGQKIGFPTVQLLNASGNFNELAPELVRGRYLKDAEREIKRDLESRGLLFERKNHTHSYPHCYRCGTPLIYNAVSSWFINIQKVKAKMLSENEKVRWVPEHLKHGRFQNIVETAPDWTISRNRFWASPLPIWKERGGDRLMVIGSLEELKQKVKKSGNTYFVMRHGESDSIVRGIASADPKANIHLTQNGSTMTKDALAQFGSARIDHIYASSLPRAKETAFLAAEHLDIPKERIIFDERITDIAFGTFEGKPRKEYAAAFPDNLAHFDHAPTGGESYGAVKRRMGLFLRFLEETHANKKILIVSHATPLWLLAAAARGASKEETIRMHDAAYPKPAEIREHPYAQIPVNKDFELDLHRPYTDRLTLVDDEGREYERTQEVVDCWVESSSMPFAQNADTRGRDAEGRRESMNDFVRRIPYPGDFIAEYIAQTRTWFYYMHAIGVLLFGKLAFRNVVSTGTILAADGSKMSKSKGNYTDPLMLLDTYGADALRLHLMGSVVMQAEDLNFRDEDVRDAHNRVVGILWNTYKFFELYKAEYDGKTDGRESPNVLDRWIYERLNETIEGMTEALDSFDTPRAVRAVRTFIDDYSTWYVRRSRERSKKASGDKPFDKAQDKQYTLATQREVLLVFSRLAAPLMPFLAEQIYRGIGGAMESVHLEDWPEPKRRGIFAKLFGESSTLESMASVRRIVSNALEARAAAKIRVRQPLSTLSISENDISAKDRDALLPIIADEVNVKKVQISAELGKGEVQLDTVLIPDLIREGDERDVVRAVQSLRKALKFKPSDRVPRMLVAATGPARVFIEEKDSTIREQTGVDKFEFSEFSDGAAVEISEGNLRLKID